jgi:hypothetical protein
MGLGEQSSVVIKAFYFPLTSRQFSQRTAVSSSFPKTALRHEQTSPHPLRPFGAPKLWSLRICCRKLRSPLSTARPTRQLAYL